jgi:hypothetical protein
MGLLRKALVIGGLLYFLPSPPAEQGTATEPSTLATLQAAGQTVYDMKDFCGRQPEVCSIGWVILNKAESKAKYNAQLLYEWANPHAAQRDVATGTLKPADDAPPLRLTTIVDQKPTKIEDLLKASTP